jgi:hypothetical protein
VERVYHGRRGQLAQGERGEGWASVGGGKRGGGQVGAKGGKGHH